MPALPLDVRSVIRALRASPGFVFIAVLTLALGIGATTLVYSVLDAVVLRPLPCPEPDRIVLVVESHAQRGKMLVRPANYEDWRRRAPWLDRSGMAFGTSFVVGGEDAHVRGALADDGFFATWDVRPQLGRAFIDSDFRRPIAVDPFFGQRGDVALISDGLWKRRFGADPRILGRPIVVDGARHTIVGVMPPSFRTIDRADVFVPWLLGPRELAERSFHYFPVVARLKAGVPREQAQAELATVYRSLAADHPEDAGWSAVLESPHEMLLGTTPRVLAMLLAAVSLVLLIGCANIANLLLARGIARGRDTAIRLALGATRARLIRQQLVEAGVLAAAGALAAVVLALVSVRTIAALPAISTLPFTYTPAIDLRVILFTSAIAGACVLLSAAAPALTGSRADLRQSLASSRGLARAAATHRLRSGLVVGQVAMAVVVVTVAILMTRSLLHLQQVDPGVRTDGLLTFRVEPPIDATAQASRTFYGQLLDRLRSLGGVETVAITGYLPLTDPGRTWRFSIDRRVSTSSGDEYFAVPAEVSPGFFRALAIRKIAGRLFDATDRADGPGVAVISQTSARQYWPDEDPIGHRIKIAGDGRWFTIVGIVADVSQAKLQEAPAPALYVPWDQMPYVAAATVIVRTDGEPLSVATAARSVVHGIAPTIPVDDVRSMASVQRAVLGESAFRTAMLASFAILALFLGAIGIYGVLAQLVGERRQEMGVRLAIGATGRDIVALVVKQAARMVGAGIAIGLLAGVATSSLIQAFLFNVSATDAASLAGSVALFAFAAALAAYLPARRAARVDPMTVLRAE